MTDPKIKALAEAAKRLNEVAFAAGRADADNSRTSKYVETARERRQACMQALLDAIEDIAAQVGAEPAGWKLVPADPTEDMLISGQEAWVRVRKSRQAVEDCVEATFVYLAMLRAAPTPAPEAK